MSKQNYIVQRKNPDTGQWENEYSGNREGAKEHFRKLNDRKDVRIINGVQHAALEAKRAAEDEAALAAVMPPEEPEDQQAGET